MKLYDLAGTPNAARIRIVLAAKGLNDAVDFVRVDLINAEQKSPEFLALNPIGKTPVLLLDDGLALSECTAITVYLDELDGQPLLTGRTARERAVIHMMQRRVEIMLLDPVDDYFHYGTRGLGEKLRPWRKPEWEGRHEWGIRRGAEAVASLPYFEGLLAGSPFIPGDSFSMADISLWAGLDFASRAGLAIPPELTAIAAFRARVEALPAVADRSGKKIER